MRKLIQPIVASVAGAASASALAEPARAGKPMQGDRGVARDPAAAIPTLTVVSRRFLGPLGSETFSGNMKAA